MEQDFGSDEEDDDFNPAPAQESDNEDVDRGQTRKRGREDDAQDRGDDDDGENEGGGDDDELQEGGDEDEEEEEEEEDEEEDAVTVRVFHYLFLLKRARGNC